MPFRRFLNWPIVLIVFAAGAFHRSGAVQAAPSNQVSAYELILAMNTLRVSYGLPALIEDSIVNAVAQSTAETMAANNMSWHIGDVRGRLAAARYGAGGTVWATENFAVSSGSMGIDEIMALWSDADHMRPAVEAAYCHIGAGRLPQMERPITSCKQPMFPGRSAVVLRHRLQEAPRKRTRGQTQHPNSSYR